jgi:hypothetical protein
MTGMGEGAGVMFELDSAAESTENILRRGWLDLLTADQPHAFQPAAQSLLHHDLYTIYKETKSCEMDGYLSLFAPGDGLCGLFLCNADLVITGRLTQLYPSNFNTANFPWFQPWTSKYNCPSTKWGHTWWMLVRMGMSSSPGMMVETNSSPVWV